MDFLPAFLKANPLIKSLNVSDQWRAEVWWCPGLQTNVLAKFVDAICILFYTHSP